MTKTQLYKFTLILLSTMAMWQLAICQTSNEDQYESVLKALLNNALSVGEPTNECFVSIEGDNPSDTLLKALNSDGSTFLNGELAGTHHHNKGTVFKVDGLAYNTQKKLYTVYGQFYNVDGTKWIGGYYQIKHSNADGWVATRTGMLIP